MIELKTGDEEMTADIVIKSNVIYSGRGREIISGGVAVKDNLIIAVASEAEIAEYVGKETAVYEYKDKLVMPGLIDNHVHVTMGAMMHDNDLNLEGTCSAEECAEMARAFLEKNPDTSLLVASMILGGGLKGFTGSFFDNVYASFNNESLQ